MTSTETQDQITQKQSKLTQLQEQLPSLKRQRAELTLQPVDPTRREQIKVLVQTIQETEQAITDIPLQIEVLQSQLRQAQEHEQVVTAKLVEQEALVPQMLSLSKKLVKQLQTAKTTNDQLKALQDQYQALRSVTGQDTLPMEYAAPSTGYLDVVTDILSQELDGDRPGRHIHIQVPV